MNGKQLAIKVREWTERNLKATEINCLDRVEVYLHDGRRYEVEAWGTIIPAPYGPPVSGDVAETALGDIARVAFSNYKVHDVWGAHYADGLRVAADLVQR